MMLAQQVWRTCATLVACGAQPTATTTRVRCMHLSKRVLGASLFNSPLAGPSGNGVVTPLNATIHTSFLVAPPLVGDFTTRRGLASKVSKGKGKKYKGSNAYKSKKNFKDLRRGSQASHDDFDDVDDFDDYDDYDDMDYQVDWETDDDDYEDDTPKHSQKKPWQVANSRLAANEEAENAGWTLNEQIRDRFVHIVLDDGTMKKHVSKLRALEEARERGLDLIKVAQTKDGAICKMFNVKQRLYELRKKGKRSKPKPEKEMWYSAKTELHDLQVKSKRVQEFLSKGHPVRVLVKYSFDNPPRSKAEQVMNQLLPVFEPVATLHPVKHQFNALSLYLTPKSKK